MSQVINNTLPLPIWVQKVIAGWIDEEGRDRTRAMIHAEEWKEIRGKVHGRQVMEELEGCLKINVLPDQWLPLYAACGWLAIHLPEMR